MPQGLEQEDVIPQLNTGRAVYLAFGLTLKSKCAEPRSHRDLGGYFRLFFTGSF